MPWTPGCIERVREERKRFWNQETSSPSLIIFFAIQQWGKVFFGLSRPCTNTFILKLLVYILNKFIHSYLFNSVSMCVRIYMCVHISIPFNVGIFTFCMEKIFMLNLERTNQIYLHLKWISVVKIQYSYPLKNIFMEMQRFMNISVT